MHRFLLLLRLHLQVRLPLPQLAEFLVHVIAVLAGAEFGALVSSGEALAVLLLAFRLLAVASFVLLLNALGDGLLASLRIDAVEALFAAAARRTVAASSETLAVHLQTLCFLAGTTILLLGKPTLLRVFNGFGIDCFLLRNRIVLRSVLVVQIVAGWRYKRVY